MKKSILYFIGVTFMLLSKNTEKILMSYSLSNETFMGYEECESSSCYYNISKNVNGIWDNYLGLIRIRDTKFNIIENITVYSDKRIVYTKNNKNIELHLKNKEKIIFEEKYKNALKELEENYILEKIILVDKISPFSINKVVEIVELGDYAYLTFIPGEYTTNKIYDKESNQIQISYTNTKNLIDYLKKYCDK
ncbi:hypothetical protein [Sebaldella sp. S0638]|uniref:hypothetical protein n=1 Tax=Sebaldella sp. S0638 TaxID=2957809 RepID=UPI0020A1FBED|nr:hypothetical protein [Sebaldella sp. S0638]MCP1226579.1 hypothetical protein [Sebaldella sp. S0638]